MFELPGAKNFQQYLGGIYKKLELIETSRDGNGVHYEIINHRGTKIGEYFLSHQIEGESESTKVYHGNARKWPSSSNLKKVLLIFTKYPASLQRWERVDFNTDIPFP